MSPFPPLVFNCSLAQLCLELFLLSPTPYLEASDIMKSIGEAIQYLHAIDIAHRDIKVKPGQFQSLWPMCSMRLASREATFMSVVQKLFDL